MSRAGLQAFSGTIRFVLIALVSGIVCHATGCGGQVFDGEGGDGGETAGGGTSGGETAGGGSSGTGAGSSGSKSGGVGGGGTAGAGGVRPTGGRPATGGVSPAGGRLATGGTPPTGARPSTGGQFSGGVPGAGGGPTTDAATLCYAQGGVYFPDGGGCFLGSETNAACLREAQPITRSCDNRCSCRACPSFYSRCLNDGGCRFIVTCAQLELCRGVADCMRTSCSFIIDRAGGPSSIGALYFDHYSNCMSDFGCSCDLL